MKADLQYDLKEIDARIRLGGEHRWKPSTNRTGTLHWVAESYWVWTACGLPVSGSGVALFLTPGLKFKRLCKKCLKSARNNDAARSRDGD